MVYNDLLLCNSESSQIPDEAVVPRTIHVDIALAVLPPVYVIHKSSTTDTRII